MQLNLYLNVLCISTILHIYYPMTCSEYVVSDYHADIYLAVTAYGKYLKMLVYLKMGGNLLETG